MQTILAQIRLKLHMGFLRINTFDLIIHIHLHNEVNQPAMFSASHDLSFKSLRRFIIQTVLYHIHSDKVGLTELGATVMLI